QANVFKGVPKLLPLSRIGKKAPIVVFPKQVINPCGGRGFGRRNRLTLEKQRAGKKHDHQDREGSHLSLRFTLYEAISSASIVRPWLAVLFLCDGMNLGDISSRKLHDSRIAFLSLVRRYGELYAYRPSLGKGVRQIRHF